MRRFFNEVPMLTRREFMVSSAAATAVRFTPPTATLPAVISTWEFGKAANGEAWNVLEAGGNALDAVEKGVNQAEMDPGNTSVGYGGLPDEEGEVTNDAIIFWGPTHGVGAVGCLKRIKRPISVARKVMERTKHTLLVGEDATRFAVKMGWKEEALLTEKSRKIWETWKENPGRKSFWNHDTIGMVAVDSKGDVCAGTSTSGLAFKLKGRVGDTPIPGSGAYVDNDIGGAAATGNGDIMMRFCVALMAVESMRTGASPSDACARSLERIEAKGYKTQACLVAVNKKGEFGAARIGLGPFPFAVRNGSIDQVRQV
jgi:N4-(beta-N-acetylglucosaminyl)-L-asparaginase